METDTTVCFKCHKAILARGSTYFDAVIHADKDSCVITLPCTFQWPAFALKHCIELLYGRGHDEIEQLIHAPNIHPILYGNKTYVFDSARDGCTPALHGAVLLGCHSDQQCFIVKHVDGTIRENVNPYTRCPIVVGRTHGNTFGLATQIQVASYFGCTTVLKRFVLVSQNYVRDSGVLVSFILLETADTYKLTELRTACIQKLARVFSYLLVPQRHNCREFSTIP